eukprot:759551-Hanusia_phi.AAC.2
MDVVYAPFYRRLMVSRGEGGGGCAIVRAFAGRRRREEVQVGHTYMTFLGPFLPCPSYASLTFWLYPPPPPPPPPAFHLYSSPVQVRGRRSHPSVLGAGDHRPLPWRRGDDA